MGIKIVTKESMGIDRHNEPVTLGVPFGIGQFRPSDTLILANNNKQSPLQSIILNCWPDGSVKWALIDFQANSKKNSTELYTLSINNKAQLLVNENHVEINENENRIDIETGAARFSLERKLFRPFSEVFVNGKQVCGESCGRFVLEDMGGNLFEPEIESYKIELNGSLHSVIGFNGFFGDKKKPLIRWIARVHFYGGKTGVKIDFTLWNPKPAKHIGGLWDLGDPGSFFFRDLSFNTWIEATEAPVDIQWTQDGTEWFHADSSKPFCIYQGSSGGERYKSRNHVNFKGEIPIKLKGYKVTEGDHVMAEGLRAEPVIHVSHNRNSVSLIPCKFWQNFPKSVKVDGCSASIGIFPGQFDDPFELQGGERKTHTFHINYQADPLSLTQSVYPLSVHVEPVHTLQSDVIPYLTSNPESEDPVYRELINGIVEGENSFFKRRETIDEYGWRHFGELYADHEAVGYKGDGEFISHYNNQYDFIYCAARQYFSTGDSRWFELMDDLARHVRDIDIYYTDKDRAEYNGGLFWHTNHYLHAATCTHRSESADHLKYSNPQFCGGGPALEHVYTSGLMTHYLMTGEEASKEAVLSQANWVVTMMGRPFTILDIISKIKARISLLKRVFSGERVRHYPYPFTRESGNCITALMDAYSLTGDRMYFEKAEETIRGCINPNDDIDQRGLLNAELGWSYTACLQAVGKYLDYKVIAGEYDDMFHYARVTLLKYAQWMLENEYPYLDKADVLEYPNETWPAQDMRKSSIFYHASKYTDGEQRQAFLEKGRYYYDYAVHAVDSFETRSLTRPLVLLLQNSIQHHSFMETPEKFGSVQSITGQPETFPDNILSRWGVLKLFAGEFFNRLVHFSLKKEIHWLKCKLNKHA